MVALVAVDAAVERVLAALLLLVAALVAVLVAESTVAPHSLVDPHAATRDVARGWGSARSAPMPSAPCVALLVYAAYGV